MNIKKPVTLRYLVCGTGRSGSVYMARLMTSLGIPCGHESIFDWHGLEVAKRRVLGEEFLSLSGASMIRKNLVTETNEEIEPWWDLENLQAESSYMAAPFLNQPEFSNIPLLHVVRHPIRVVQSFCNYIDYFQHSVPQNQYELFIYEHVPELQNDLSAYDRACLYYIRWNQLIEAGYGNRCLIRWKVEDNPDKLLNLLVGGSKTDYFNDTSVNTFQRRQSARFTLSAIQRQDIRREFVEIGERYGYYMGTDVLFL